MLDCPPCRIYYMLVCIGCPIADYTGKKFCKDTPYGPWYRHQIEVHDKMRIKIYCPECLRLAKEMHQLMIEIRDFLLAKKANKEAKKKLMPDQYLAKIFVLLKPAFLLCLGYLAFIAHAFTPIPEHLNFFEMIVSYKPDFSFFPTNSMILSRHFLRFDMTWGIVIIGFAGYISLISFTYSLSRRYAWMPISFTVALMVASMPRFIHHAQGSGFEIVPASMALFAILLTYRLIETPQLSDLLLLITALIFISSHGPISLIFAGILAILCLLLLFRRHGLIILMLVKKSGKYHAQLLYRL